MEIGNLFVLLFLSLYSQQSSKILPLANTSVFLPKACVGREEKQEVAVISQRLSSSAKSEQQRAPFQSQDKELDGQKCGGNRKCFT